MSGLGFDPADAPVLQTGSQDQEWVAYLQQVLSSLGYPCGTADGTFGTMTESMLTEFQRNHGLDANGVADYGTWAALGTALDGGDTSGYGFDSSGGWQDTGHEQAPAGGDEMTYLLPEDERQLVDPLGCITSIERSGDTVVATARVTNLGNDSITDVEVTVTLTSEYGRQESASSQTQALPPSEAIEVYVQMAIEPGEHNYSMVMFGVGNGVLPVTHADAVTIDPYA